MRKTCDLSCDQSLNHFLTPQVWKQAHQAWAKDHWPSRWKLKPLLWVLLRMAWCNGDSQEERFATARAAYIAAHPRERRPGQTLAGFLQAVAKLPMPVLHALSGGIRERIGNPFVDSLRINGLLPIACDGARLECPRAEELQECLGEAGKADSAPTVYVTALVLLPLGLPWAWHWGKGTASEHAHLQQLLPTLPERSLLVADAGYLGFELFSDILTAQASFLVRLSSRAYLYTESQTPLSRFRQGIVYYWPEKFRKRGLAPIKARLICVRGKHCDVWLLTNVLDRKQLSRANAARVYRWRWRNEGLFRDYKRLLKKTKLYSRTVKLVHREAEGAMLALQLLLLLATPTAPPGKPVRVYLDSPRRTLLRLRGEITGLLRRLGPRQFADYLRRLAVVRTGPRLRKSAKVRQDWPRRKKHKPPKPPKMRRLTIELKRKIAKHLRAA
jgi:Transposase DDE domain